MLTPVHTEAAARQPPHSHEGEQILLGCILTNNRALERVADFLTHAHFADPLHGRIYAACATLAARGDLADKTTVASALAGDVDLARLGGDNYLRSIVAAACPIFSAADYGKMIFDLDLRRRLIETGETMVNDAFQPEGHESGLDQLQRAEGLLTELAATGPTSAALRAPADYIDRVVEQAEKVYKEEKAAPGIKTGYTALDRKLGAMRAGDLILLGARPSMGKSAIALGIAIAAAKAGDKVAFFSVEMEGDKIWSRAIAHEASISTHAQQNGPLSDFQIRAIIDKAAELKRLPLYLDDSQGLTVASIKSRARRAFGKKRDDGKPPGLIIIDYLQLLAGTVGKNDRNRTEEIGTISRDLKRAAKELGVPILALCQLSRALESRDDKRPVLSDLRDAGNLEQDADVVLLLYREEYYLAHGKPKRAARETDGTYAARLSAYELALEELRNLAEVDVAKQRQGPTGVIKLIFEAEFTRMSNPISQSTFDLREEN